MTTESDNVSKSVDISLTPIITALAKPTADFLGKELRDVVKSQIDDLKERWRKENILEHVRAVQSSLEESTASRPRKHQAIQNATLLDEWIKGAQEVTPDDGELASMWRNLLLGIVLGQTADPILIEKLRVLRPSTATLLIKCVRNGKCIPDGDRTEHYLKMLAEQGLVKRDWTKGIMVVLMSAVVLVMFWFYLVVLSRFTSEAREILSGYMFLIFLSAFALVFGVGFYKKRYSPLFSLHLWRPTWIAEELVSFAPTDAGREAKEKS